MRIQLWSYNYDPEPQGIGPLSTVVTEALVERGHDVLVVAAHPHYPRPVWGTRRRPYRERRGGVPVLRLPLWIGRRNGFERIRQELSFALAQSGAAAVLPECDVVVAVSPSFPALAPCMAMCGVRRTPWILWLQDIVTDGAATTGLLEPGGFLRAARRFESAAYASAERIVVISETFRRNLVAKGVPDEKIIRIYNPLTPLVPRGGTPTRTEAHPPRLLAMGNIGHSQGLDRVVEAFERSQALAERDARLIIAGHGVEADNVRARIRGNRVTMTGVLDHPSLDPELRKAAIGLVSQRPDVTEFNLPSKLMNFMAYGVPVVASVRLESETARIVNESGAGWVTDAADPDALAVAAARALDDWRARERASASGQAYAAEHFEPARVAERFERVLEQVVSPRQLAHASARHS